MNPIAHSLPSSFPALRRSLLAALALALPAGPTHAGSPAAPPDSTPASPVATWWNGKYASGTWFGLRPALEDHGVVFSGAWKGTFYGLTGGGVDSPHGAFDEEIILALKLDFERMFGATGLSAVGSVRWRDGENPNAYVGASPAFNPSPYQVGKQWRLMPFYLMWESRDLLPVPDMITISGGWQNPYYFFAQQPESKLFVNNAIFQTKGIGANIPFNGSYVAWGGHLKVKPTTWSYAQAGLYMAIPGATDTPNHGLGFEGAYPQDRNGLYFMGETGITPKLGTLPGKYAMGGYLFGVENRSFFGETYDEKWGLYWQADQMLFREPAPAVDEPAPLAKGATDGKGLADAADAKSFKSPVSVEKPKLSEQGLYAFSFLNYAPKYNNALPLYFHAGLVYKGLVPGRDLDQLGVAFALGNYSYYKIVAEEDAGKSVHQTNEMVLEVDYRVQVNKFLYVQPFWQYLIRPNGTGLVHNANVLGLHMGVTF